ncbi:hypothetical protein ACFVX3_32080 [Rhodococcus erythropolis]
MFVLLAGLAEERILIRASDVQVLIIVPVPSSHQLVGILNPTAIS